jgi:O-antigen/teichoic acid export membrane protein
LPILSNAWIKKEIGKFSNLVSTSIDAMLLIALPMTVGTWILGVRIMEAVAGVEFADSGRVLNILIIATTIIYLNVAFSHAVVALDAQRKMLPVYGIVAIVTVSLYLWLIPMYGIWAAAWLTVFSEIVITLGNIYVTHQRTKIVFKPKATLASIGACILMAAAIWPLQSYFLPIPVLTGAFAYAIALYFLGGIPKDLLREILSSKRIGTPPPEVSL